MRDDAVDVAYRGPDIPRPIGKQLQVLLELDERPKTFADWVEAMVYITERDGIEVNLDALCTTNDSPHRAQFGGEYQHYQCSQDAFIVPFLADDIDAVTIETVSPIEHEPITIEMSSAGLEVEPPEAVMSFGITAELDVPDEYMPSPILAYSQICPYGNAFVSEVEYQRWAQAVPAHTMVVSMEDTLEFARAIGRAV